MKLQENKLNYPIATLTELREAVRLRKDKATELVSTELSGVSQGIKENSNSLNNGKKSDMVKRFPTCNYIELYETKTSSARVFDLSLLTKSHIIIEKDTFYIFTESLIKRLLHLCKNYERCDFIADRYLQNSPKENIRNTREQGS